MIKNLLKKIPGVVPFYHWYHDNKGANWLGEAKCKYLAVRGYGKSRSWSYHPVFEEIAAHFKKRTDISDHLPFIFHFTLEARPQFIVELGTRGGESTKALLGASQVCQAKMLSVDIEDCSHVDLPFKERWNFVQADDVEFAKSGFSEWCEAHDVKAQPDVIFLDTSHQYEHTVEELKSWYPLLASGGLLMFHDTNMADGYYWRMDRTVGRGWQNNRGVIRAIEEYFNKKYDESLFFMDITENFSIVHYPNCDGLTIIKKL